MRQGLFSLFLLLLIATACSEDPVPTYVSGNPRIDFVRDSVVMLRQMGEVPYIWALTVTPEGSYYAAGAEVLGNVSQQGNLWKLHDGIWRTALDQGTLDRVLSMTDVATSPSGAVWTVAGSKEQTPSGYSIILRGFDDNWMDVSPSTPFAATRLTVAGEDDVWAYGPSTDILHYESGSWEYRPLPVPFDSIADDSEGWFQVQSVAANAFNSWVLVSTGLEPSTARYLLQWKQNGWEMLYAEGEVDTVAVPDADMRSRTTRSLQRLFLAPDGSLLAIGKAVYRWTGEKFEQVFATRENGVLRCVQTRDNGQVMAAGDGQSACWTDGLTWFNVHLAYDHALSISALAFVDTQAVVAAIDTASVGRMLLRGPISRITPP